MNSVCVWVLVLVIAAIGNVATFLLDELEWCRSPQDEAGRLSFTSTQVASEIQRVAGLSEATSRKLLDDRIFAEFSYVTHGQVKNQPHKLCVIYEAKLNSPVELTSFAALLDFDSAMQPVECIQLSSLKVGENPRSLCEELGLPKGSFFKLALQKGKDMILTECPKLAYSCLAFYVGNEWFRGVVHEKGSEAVSALIGSLG